MIYDELQSIYRELQQLLANNGDADELEKLSRDDFVIDI